MNKVMLSGGLGKDPTIRYMPNGDAVANFPLATSEKWKDKGTGESKESTEWHNCVAYRKTAETIGKYFTKGSGIVITDARLKTRKWTDKGGVERYTTEVIVEEFEFPPGARNAGNANTSGANAPESARPAAPPEKPNASYASASEEVPQF